jgi:hypothetical protein
LDHERGIREEGLLRETEAGGTVAGELRAEGATGHGIDRDDVRRAAKEALVEREQELKGDGRRGDPEPPDGRRRV